MGKKKIIVIHKSLMGHIAHLENHAVSNNKHIFKNVKSYRRTMDNGQSEKLT